MTRRVRTPHMALARLIAQGIFRAELNNLTPDQTMAVLRTAHMVALAGFAQPASAPSSLPGFVSKETPDA